MSAGRKTCAILLTFALAAICVAAPLLGSAASATTPAPLKIIGGIFNVYRLLDKGAKVVWGHSGITPDDILAKEIAAEGQLIDEVKDGLDQMQAELADLYNTLNLYGWMQNAWNEIPYINTYYNQLQSEISGKDYNQVPKSFIDNWTANAYPNGEDAFLQFWTALYKGGVASNQLPALEQMRNICLGDLSGTNLQQSDFSATLESTNNVPVVAERPMYFDFQDKWSGGHCVTGAKQPGTTFYFAEGTVRPTFASFLCMQNPGESDANVKITYMRGNGGTKEQSLTIPAHSRATVNVADVLGRTDGPESDFSARVDSDAAILAERPMYFNYGGKWTGGSCVRGIGSAQPVWYLAEGSTRPGFESFLSLQNPGDLPADVMLTYMRGDGGVARQGLSIAAHTRATVKVNDFLGSVDGPASDFSTRVEANAPIVAERAMYFNYKGLWDGGHSGMGQTELKTDYYFAEGTTRPGFDAYLCLQNPNDVASQVTVTYMLGDGTNVDRSVTVPAHTRSTLKANDVLGTADSAANDFSAHVKVTNSIPIVAERPMYFDYHGWTGGHTEGGADAPANKFYFAEGTVRPEFNSYLCIQNPNDRPSDVKITYMLGDGSTRDQLLTVPPRTRSTVAVGAALADTRLTGEYEKLESFFTECLYYQTMAATITCNALDYKFNGDAQNDGKAWMKNTFVPKMQQECDKFQTCVEQLVMSQAVLPTDWGQATAVNLPNESEQILARADLLCRLATGQVPLPDSGTTVPAGICGRMIYSQDLLAAGATPPVLYAQKQGSSTKVAATHSSNVSDPWLSTSAQALTYETWTPQTNAPVKLSTTNAWSVCRYTFDGLDVGTYNIVDAGGKTVATASVTSQQFQDPVNTGQTDNLIYGHFLSKQRDCLATDPSKWTSGQYESSSYTDTDSNKVSPSMLKDVTGGKVGAFAWMKKGSGTYTSEPDIHTAEFTPAANMNLSVDYSVAMSRDVNNGPSYSSYPYGYLYTRYSQHAQASGKVKIYVTDNTTGISMIILEQSKDLTNSGNDTTKSVQWSSGYSGTANASLVAGHRYVIKLSVYGKLTDANSEEACFNQLSALKALHITPK